MILSTILSVALASSLQPSSSLAAPFLAQAEGKPIQLSVGHAAPIWVDFDRDGKPDLLVGEFGSGGIRFYKNIGTAGKPKFGSFEMLQAGGKPIRVDAG